MADDNPSHTSETELKENVSSSNSSIPSSEGNATTTSSGDERNSLDVDSEGRNLTKAQQKKFEQTKVLDTDGNLLVTYHGSEDIINIFDLEEARGTEDINAFFFTANREEAEGYGSNVEEYYLNITNPADYDTAYNIFNKYKGQEGAGIKAREELQSLGYDGIIAEDSEAPEYTEYIVFDSSQIKLVSNENPTDSEDIRYSLVGANSELYPTQLEEEALRLEEEGAEPETIFIATGMFRGADGKWRYEIDDSVAVFNPKADNRLMNNPDYRRMKELEKKFLGMDGKTGTQAEWEELGQLTNTLKSVTSRPIYLADVLQHDELFRAYPQLENVKIEFVNNTNFRGQASKKSDNYVIKLRRNLKIEPNVFKTVLLHEIQHVIQKIEGFAGGSTPEAWQDVMVRANDRKIQNAVNRRNEIFNNASDKMKRLLREYNRAVSDQDYDLIEKINEQLYEEDEQTASDYMLADFNVDMYRTENEELTDSEKYYLTAGEIEARDTANRADMSAEERRAKIPQTTENGEVLFTEGRNTNPLEYRDIRYSLDVPTTYALDEEYSPFIDDDIAETKESKGAFVEIIKAANSTLNYHISDKRIEDIADNVIAQYSSKIDKDFVTKNLRNIFGAMSDNNIEDMSNALINLSEEVIRQSEDVDPYEQKNYEDFARIYTV